MDDYVVRLFAVFLAIISPRNRLHEQQVLNTTAFPVINIDAPSKTLSYKGVYKRNNMYIYIYMGAYLGKGTYWQFFHKLNSRETSLLNAANHLKIFLIEFEICLYEHLYFFYIRNPLFPIVAFISMFWQLKVNMFYPKNSFPIV